MVVVAISVFENIKEIQKGKKATFSIFLVKLFGKGSHIIVSIFLNGLLAYRFRKEWEN